jgi:RNA polymerase sigma-70 factor (ECF subfamily)
MSIDLDFEELVNLYYRDLYRFGFSLAGNDADACDLTQQTFCIWANKGHQLKNSGNVKSWLFTTLHREFLKGCRRGKRFAHEPIDEGDPNLPHVAADYMDRIDGKTLVAVLGGIEEDYRAPLVLYYLEDLSYKEIADVLAIPLGTVQSRIARAKIHLLRRLTEIGAPVATK